MKKDVRVAVRRLLDSYLQSAGHRKTPERYAILDAAYSIRGHFSLEELTQYLEERNFRVSRATIYNTIRLFIKLRLLVRHNFKEGTRYEACYDNNNHCHQVCTLCGNVTEILLPSVVTAVKQAKYRRFRQDGFTLYVYGMCNSCQAKMADMQVSEELKSKKQL